MFDHDMRGARLGAARGLGRRAAVAGVFLASAIAAAATAASWAASEVWYCDKKVPRYTACNDIAVGSAARNEAQYRGSGAVSVCEKVTSGTTLLSRRCAVTFVSSRDDLFSYPGAIMRIYVGNNSAHTHTIHGYARGTNLSD